MSLQMQSPSDGSRDSATEPEVGLEDEDGEILVASQVRRLEQLQREQQQSSSAGAEGRGLQHDPTRGEGGAKGSGGTTESMDSMASSMATVAKVMSAQQEAILAATAKAARGDMPPLDLQD